MGCYVAVDLGAGSGRVMLGTLDGGRLVLNEIHRFSGYQVEREGTHRWDTDALCREIMEGLRLVSARGQKPISMSCDTWGVDYGLIGADGKLLDLPFMYRDARTDGMMESVFSLVPQTEVFAATGIQFMKFNTIYQLRAESLNAAKPLKKAEKILMMADLLHYIMGAEAVTEHSLASTSQIFDPRTGDWAWSLVDKLGIPRNLFQKIVLPGTLIGKLNVAWAAGTGLGELPIVATCSHDTGAAVAGVPASCGDGASWAYLSCGTWSLLGAELEQPFIDSKVMNAGFTNETGCGARVRFLKNIAGLWLLQECKREWAEKGRQFSYDDFNRLSAAASPFQGRINPNHALFSEPGEMSVRIQEYLKQTGQPAPSDEGSIIRIATESLALKYREVLEIMEGLIGRRVDRLHMVGGGICNEQLCQFAANAIGRPVLAGPVEATAAGNILIQAITSGELESLEALREVVAHSFPIKTYMPEDAELWEKAYCGFSDLP